MVKIMSLKKEAKKAFMPLGGELLVYGGLYAQAAFGESPKMAALLTGLVYLTITPVRYIIRNHKDFESEIKSSAFTKFAYNYADDIAKNAYGYLRNKMPI